MKINFKILIVDNNQLSIKEIANMLEPSNFLVFQTNNLDNIHYYLTQTEIHLIVINQNQFYKGTEQYFDILKTIKKPIIIISSMFYNSLKSVFNSLINVKIVHCSELKENFIQNVNDILIEYYDE